MNSDCDWVYYCKLVCSHKAIHPWHMASCHTKTKTKKQTGIYNQIISQAKAQHGKFTDFGMTTSNQQLNGLRFLEISKDNIELAIFLKTLNG